MTNLTTRETAVIGNLALDSTRYLASYWAGSSVRGGLTGRLNDTGITQCADGATNGLTCPVTDYPDQDAQYGRDFEVNDDSDGHAGFSFTKLDEKGNELLANATNWSCVKDNVTGLIWEVKQGGNGMIGDEGLHDGDDRYH